MRFCVWSKSDNQEFIANVVFEEGSPNVYMVNGLSIVDEMITRIDTDITSNLRKELPEKFALLPNYPNPFNPETYIIFDLPKACHVKISVYNIAGQLMEELAEELMITGRHRIVWNASQYSTGNIS